LAQIQDFFAKIVLSIGQIVKNEYSILTEVDRMLDTSLRPLAGSEDERS